MMRDPGDNLLEAMVEWSHDDAIGTRMTERFRQAQRDAKANTSRPPVNVRPLRRVPYGKILAAAAVIVGIVLIAFGPSGPTNQETTEDARGVLLGDGVNTRRGAIHAELVQGWAILDDPSHSLKIYGHTLSAATARVVVVADGAASASMQTVKIEAVPQTLSEKERNMLMQDKHWLRIGGAAMCVLAGSVMLDGKAITAETAEVSSEVTIETIKDNPRNTAGIVSKDDARAFFETVTHIYVSRVHEMVASEAWTETVWYWYGDGGTTAPAITVGIVDKAKVQEIVNAAVVQFDGESCKSFDVDGYEYNAEFVGKEGKRYICSVTDHRLYAPDIMSVPVFTSAAFQAVMKEPCDEAYKKMIAHFGLVECEADAKMLADSAERVTWRWRENGAPITDVSFLNRFYALKKLELDVLENDSALASLGDMTTLKSLTLNKTFIHGQGLAWLAKTSIEELVLNEADHIDANGMQAIASLTNLKRVEFNGCESAPGMNDDGIQSLASLPSLKTLAIRSAVISDKALQAIASMASLEALTLQGCANVTDTGIKALPPIKYLKIEQCPNVTSHTTSQSTKK